MLYFLQLCDREEIQWSAKLDDQDLEGKYSEEAHPRGFRRMPFLEAGDPNSAQAKLIFVVTENDVVNCMDNHKFYSIQTCLLHQNKFPTKK